MNWGWSIVWSFVGFALFIGYLAVRSFQTNVDLVTEDYYQQELEYQNRIEHTTNANQLEEKLSISQEEQQLTIQFPEAVAKNIQGTISLFRPSDARFDYSTEIEIDETRQQKVSTDKLPKGYYKVQIALASDSKNYYWEKPIFLR